VTPVPGLRRTPRRNVDFPSPRRRKRKGAVQFSVANVTHPGTFDDAALDGVSSPGLSFFLRLPGPQRPLEAFDCMLETARVVARKLDGELQDESHSVFTSQTAEHYRQRIREFVHRISRPRRWGRHGGARRCARSRAVARGDPPPQPSLLRPRRSADPDSEYDRLLRRLQELERRIPNWSRGFPDAARRRRCRWVPSPRCATRSRCCRWTTLQRG
jgi:hypothetical protein